MTMLRDDFLQSPAQIPPPGVEANFEHPSNTFSYAWPCFIVVVSIANLVFFANAYVKVRIIKKFLLEDYLLVLAWVRT
jgi:hypothetical protein